MRTVTIGNVHINEMTDAQGKPALYVGCSGAGVGTQSVIVPQRDVDDFRTAVDAFFRGRKPDGAT